VANVVAPVVPPRAAIGMPAVPVVPARPIGSRPTIVDAARARSIGPTRAVMDVIIVPPIIAGTIGSSGSVAIAGAIRSIATRPWIPRTMVANPVGPLTRASGSITATRPISVAWATGTIAVLTTATRSSGTVSILTTAAGSTRAVSSGPRPARSIAILATASKSAGTIAAVDHTRKGYGSVRSVDVPATSGSPGTIATANVAGASRGSLNTEEIVDVAGAGASTGAIPGSWTIARSWDGTRLTGSCRGKRVPRAGAIRTSAARSGYRAGTLVAHVGPVATSAGASRGAIATADVAGECGRSIGARDSIATRTGVTAAGAIARSCVASARQSGWTLAVIGTAAEVR
jgi:hypothetical protein